MSDVRPTITLDGNNTYYRPGDNISGTVHLHADAGWTCLYVDVVAGWRTSGRGDSDHEGEASVRLFKPGESIPPIVERRFTLRLPTMPWSYQGVALKIHWTIGVYLCAEGEKEQLDQIGITLHPNSRAFDSQGCGAASDAEHDGVAE